MEVVFPAAISSTKEPANYTLTTMQRIVTPALSVLLPDRKSSPSFADTPASLAIPTEALASNNGGRKGQKRSKRNGKAEAHSDDERDLDGNDDTDMLDPRAVLTSTSATVDTKSQFNPSGDNAVTFQLLDWLGLVACRLTE